MLTVRRLLQHLLNRQEYVDLIDVRTNKRLACGMAGRMQFSEYKDAVVSYFYTDTKGSLYVAVEPLDQVCDE